MTRSDHHTLDPAQMSWVDVYRRLTEIVIPRPIAWVATVNAAGQSNLAPFSFFTIVSSNPPYLAFSPHRSGRKGDKDTLLNIRETGEFVVSVVTEELADAANRTAAALPRGESEIEHAGLTATAATRVRPPLIAESPVNLECELVEVRTYGDEGGAGNLVVGRVLLIHVDRAVLDGEGAVAPELLRAVGRMGGSAWVRTGDTFSLPRPGR